MADIIPHVLSFLAVNLRYRTDISDAVPHVDMRYRTLARFDMVLYDTPVLGMMCGTAH
jgi:hypothetical protein